MKEFIKKNFALIIAFILPIGLIAVVALNAYLPSLFVSTDYNFIYATCAYKMDSYTYNCGNFLFNRYSVVNNKLVINYQADPGQDDRKYYNSRIFYHNTKKNESKEITFEQAQKLNLSGLLTSPDGFTISNLYDRGVGFFLLFDGGSSYGYYLTKGKARKKLNIINENESYYYRDNFQFLGWVLPKGDI